MANENKRIGTEAEVRIGTGRITRVFVFNIKIIDNLYSCGTATLSIKNVNLHYE